MAGSVRAPPTAAPEGWVFRPLLAALTPQGLTPCPIPAPGQATTASPGSCSRLSFVFLLLPSPLYGLLLAQQQPDTHHTTSLLWIPREASTSE